MVEGTSAVTGARRTERMGECAGASTGAIEGDNQSSRVGVGVERKLEGEVADKLVEDAAVIVGAGGATYHDVSPARPGRSRLTKARGVCTRARAVRAHSAPSELSR